MTAASLAQNDKRSAGEYSRCGIRRLQAQMTIPQAHTPYTAEAFWGSEAYGVRVYHPSTCRPNLIAVGHKLLEWQVPVTTAKMREWSWVNAGESKYWDSGLK